MTPHAATARFVYDTLIAAGVPGVHEVPVPNLPITGGAVIVGSPQLPQQVTATGCAPAEMVATVTVVASGPTRGGVLDLYRRTDEVLTALLGAGGWQAMTVPTVWQATDVPPMPATTVTVSVPYLEE